MKAETKMSILFKVKEIVLLGFVQKWTQEKHCFLDLTIFVFTFSCNREDVRTNVSSFNLRSKWNAVDNTTIRNTSYSPSPLIYVDQHSQETCKNNQTKIKVTGEKTMPFLLLYI